MKDTIQDSLIALIRSALAAALPGALGGGDITIDFPSDPRFGDLSTNVALRLSKQLKKSPLEVAGILIEEIKCQLASHPLKDYVKDVRAEGAGFVNFYLHNRYFYEGLRQILENGKEALRLDVGKGECVLIEFVSANPTGPLSVAHARQAVVGDCLANILEFLKFKVCREYYLNDEGNQITILGKSILLRLQEIRGERVEFPENHYQGDYIYDIARDYGRFLQEGASAAAAADPGDFAGNYILNIIRKELDDFGIRFDSWFSQKELRTSGKIDTAFAHLREKGFLYEQEGALWFKSTEFGDDKDRVVIKSDGSYTYLAPDIAYHQDKFNRGFSWLINLWGPDHHGYIGRLKASVEAFGHSADALSIVIVQLASIFRDGKLIEMSTRKGQYITLREVLDEVGKDASRFFFLMRRTSSHLDFDLAIAKKQTSENPVYYVQYAHARICSILRSSPVPVRQDVDLSALVEPEEMALVKKELQFPYILYVCLQTRDPYMVTVYLQELAETFHKFYDKHRVLGQSEEITQARLALANATKIVLAAGLELLGVSLPEKM